MKILQINSTLNTGSTGRITEEIGNKIIENGGISYVAYGRNCRETKSIPIKIGNKFNQAFHLFQSRLFDNHGLASKNATLDFINKIKLINPDLIHIHNIHGYYINYRILFHFLKDYKKPVVWTFHDCWPFTGHCPHFVHVNCKKWIAGCYKCPLKKRYPKSIIIDRSKRNYALKNTIFNSIDNLHIVTVSNWLKELVQLSFLKNKNIRTIYNGIDLNTFKPIHTNIKQKLGIEEKKFILGVANIWPKIKGLDDFIKLREILDPSIAIVLIGLNNNQINKLPPNIIGIARTDSVNELASYYSAADVFINPSILESFSLVTAEAMACGTPVIVYKGTASPEIITPDTGFAIEKENIRKLHDAIKVILEKGKNHYSENCRKQAEQKFDKNIQYTEYIELYNSLLST